MNATALLQAARERSTPARVAVLDLLLNTEHALSHHDLESALRETGAGMDRVTLYRTLDWLVARSLAHRIAGLDRVWRFNAVEHDNHGHAHFHCLRCDQVFCLDDLPANALPSLPPGFRSERTELTIEGYCPGCN